MSKQRASFWSALFGAAPTDRHSLTELQRLHSLLLSNPVVNEYNKASVIETLRALAEILIWGDQHEPRVFEYFLEHNLLQHFKGILAVPAHRKGEVAVQLLQTLSILITNIRKDTSLYYIFSNNHINDIVALSFDFRDEEVLAHYITFLKAISFKLNASTIQFFFQQDATGRSTFPLYTEAIKLFNHPEGMVRAAVRMLTINIYGVADPGMQAYIVSPPSVNYFHELALLLADRAAALDIQLEALQRGHASAVESVNARTAEIEDALAYVSDILHVAPAPLEGEVTAAMWESFVAPLALQPLLLLQDGGGGEPSSPGCRVRLVTALHVLERCCLQLAASPVVDAIACALLAGAPEAPAPVRFALPSPSSAAPPGAAASFGDADAPGAAPAAQRGDPGAAPAADAAPGHVNHRATLNGSPFRDEAPGGSGAQQLWERGDGTPVATPGARSPAVTPSLRLSNLRSGSSQRLGTPSPYSAAPRTMSMRARLMQCRAAFLSCFGAPGSELPAASVRALVALMQGRVSDHVAAAVGLAGATVSTRAVPPPPTDAGAPSPRPRAPAADAAAGPAAGEPTTPNWRGGSPGVGTPATSGRGFDPSSRFSIASTLSSTSSYFNEMLVDDLVRSVVNNSIDASAARTAALTAELAAAVAAALESPALAPQAVAACGWLLRQLLPAGGAAGGSALPADSQAALAAGAAAAREAFGAQLHAPWCDALPMLVHAEWPRLRPIAAAGKFGASAADLFAWMSPPPAAPAAPSQRAPSPRAASFSHATVAVAAVQRVCAFLQVEALLGRGAVPPEAPIPALDLEALELRDGNMVSTSGAHELPCKVSFRRGEEKTVYLTLLGARGGHASPQAVLAEPAPQCLSAGRVLSAAPLMAVGPTQHEKQPQWLQCNVRPSVKMLRNILAAAQKAGVPFALSSSSKQLDDGLWVLAFPDAGRAVEAIDAVAKVVMKSQAEFFDILAPLHAKPPPGA